MLRHACLTEQYFCKFTTVRELSPCLHEGIQCKWDKWIGFNATPYNHACITEIFSTIVLRFLFIYITQSTVLYPPEDCSRATDSKTDSGVW